MSETKILFEGEVFTQAELEALRDRAGISDSRRVRIEAKLKQIKGSR